MAIQSEPAEDRDADQRADHEGGPEATDIRRHLTEPGDQGAPQRQGQRDEVRQYRNGLFASSGQLIEKFF